MIENITVREGDLLVLRGEFEYKSVASLIYNLKKRNLQDVTIAFLREDQSIQSLNEEQMRQHGWRKIVDENNARH